MNHLSWICINIISLYVFQYLYGYMSYRLWKCRPITSICWVFCIWRQISTVQPFLLIRIYQINGWGPVYVLCKQASTLKLSRTTKSSPKCSYVVLQLASQWLCKTMQKPWCLYINSSTLMSIKVISSLCDKGPGGFKRNDSAGLVITLAELSGSQ